ncbi:MAG: hypothetical protein MZV64_42685 [Ignavibacteriales bacterium]|nr:hypothetical protein [Ignavibacteriales bacterium]
MPGEVLPDRTRGVAASRPALHRHRGGIDLPVHRAGGLFDRSHPPPGGHADTDVAGRLERQDGAGAAQPVDGGRRGVAARASGRRAARQHRDQVPAPGGGVASPFVT